MMDILKLPGKIIADKNSRRLGFVLDIRQAVLYTGEQEQSKPKMLVKIDRILKNAMIVEVDVVKILKIDGYYAWLDITKKEFDLKIKQIATNVKSKNNQKTATHLKPISKSSQKLEVPNLPIEQQKKQPIHEVNEELRSSSAFKEYNSKQSKKLATPWLAISLLGTATAVLSLLLYYYGLFLLDNPFAMNLIIGLLGIPAGFIIAFKNSTLDIMVSWRYSSYTGIIFTIVYFLIGLIFTTIGTIGIQSLFGSILNLLLSCLVIGVYSILVTFALGALLGTMINGYLESRR